MLVEGRWTHGSTFLHIKLKKTLAREPMHGMHDARRYPTLWFPVQHLTSMTAETRGPFFCGGATLQHPSPTPFSQGVQLSLEGANRQTDDLKATAVAVSHKVQSLNDGSLGKSQRCCFSATPRGNLHLDDRQLAANNMRHRAGTE